MSKINLAQVRLRAQACSAVAQACAIPVDALAALETLSTYFPADMSADVLATAGPTVDVGDWFRDLAPAAVDALTMLAPDTWAVASAAIVGRSDVTVMAAADLAAQAIAVATAAVGEATRQAVVSSTEEFVASRYDTYAVYAGETFTGIEAHRDDGAVTLFRIGADRSVDRDYHGYDGFTCDDSDEAYVQFMSGRGFELDSGRDEHHGDRDDSARLIPAAVRCDRDSLARGVVLTAEAAGDADLVSAATTGRLRKSIFTTEDAQVHRRRASAGGVR